LHCQQLASSLKQCAGIALNFFKEFFFGFKFFWFLKDLSIFEIFLKKVSFGL